MQGGGSKDAGLRELFQNDGSDLMPGVDILLRPQEIYILSKINVRKHVYNHIIFFTICNWFC